MRIDSVREHVCWPAFSWSCDAGPARCKSAIRRFFFWNGEGKKITPRVQIQGVRVWSQVSVLFDWRCCNYFYNYREYRIYPTVVALLRESCTVKQRKVEGLKRERKMCKCCGPWASCRPVNLIFDTLIYIYFFWTGPVLPLSSPTAVKKLRGAEKKFALSFSINPIFS